MKRVKYTAKEMNNIYDYFEFAPADSETMFFKNWALINKCVRIYKKEGKCFSVKGFKRFKHQLSKRVIIGTEQDLYA